MFIPLLKKTQKFGLCFVLQIKVRHMLLEILEFGTFILLKLKNITLGSDSINLDSRNKEK